MPNIMEMGKNPNYLGAWDLYDLSPQKITATIKEIKDEGVVANGKTETCTVLYFAEDIKPMILNPTNKKTLARLFATKSSEKMVGKRISIHFEKVKAFGTIHDALRIDNVLPASKAAAPVKCESCGKAIAPAYGMTAEQTAAYTKSKYGKQLCAECATAESDKIKESVNIENN